ncbi:MAG TPA: hypothetical protein VGV37_13115 [Aliidongia sp.]|uniref:hypothetical protein n=1 Tax=Aliidongia sp. TaxID=1914230 RepID=UPI002DDD07CF|nr:hypothetical protein [Aliidongia sp.]HEV2675477.1 hypothetical protein [Aliidongia sp.]
MSRQEILISLVQLDASVAVLKTALATFGWDSDPLATLTRSDLISVLQRFSDGELDCSTVEAWANLIEGREDIQFEPGHEETVANAVHDLANPQLQGQLQAMTPMVLDRLARG